MKFMKNNKIYIQNIDLIYIMEKERNIPLFIFNKLKEVEYDEEEDRNLEFVSFSNEIEIDYLNSLDWLVDYNECEKFSLCEIYDYRDSLVVYHNMIIDIFNAMSFEAQTSNYELEIEAAKLEYQVDTVDYLIAYREGEITIPFPSDSRISSIYKPSIVTRIRDLIKDSVL